MIEWFQDINWVMIMAVSVSSVLANELSRRSTETNGEIYSFLPLWRHRILNLAMCISAILLIEAARIALKQLTSFSVWMLIFAAAASCISLLALHGLEINSAKRVLKRTAMDAASQE